MSDDSDTSNLQCTLSSDPGPGFVYCDITLWGFLHYQASIPGNAFMLACFSILIPPTIYLSIKYRAYLFGSAMIIGLFAEVVGYVGRLLLHNEPFTYDWFLMYLLCTTLGPTFIAAAMYFTLGRIVVVYGESISRIRPRTYTFLFCGFDLMSLVVQAVGGALATIALDRTDSLKQEKIDQGTHILVAGLAIQVASLVVFLSLCAEFAWRVWKYTGQLNPKYAGLYNSKKFKIFQVCLLIAVLCIFTRSVFRTAELSGGFTGELAQNQVSFMILDGAMVLLACILLTVMHPGIAFGRVWQETAFKFGREKNRRVESREVFGVHEMYPAKS